MDGEATPQCPHLLDPAGQDRHGEDARLRALGPVAPVELPGGLTAWAVTGHEELQALLADPRVGKDPRGWRALAEGRVPEDWPLRAMVTVPGMTTVDGADHRRLRSLVSRAFTPRRVAALRPRAEAAAQTLLDAMAARAPGELDLVAAYAYPLPMRMIGDLLGVPEARRDELHAYSRTVVSSSAGPAESAAAFAALAGLLGEVAAERRSHPEEDVTSDLLAAAEQDGGLLSPQELVGTLVLLLVAGHGTTQNLIVNAVRALAAHPEQAALLRDGQDGCDGQDERVSWAAVVEETLRYDAPVAHFPLRYALEDLEAGGRHIARGDALLASYAAAGRDPRRHPEPDRFDLSRPPGRHLSLGHGPHFCVGAPLARLEGELALRHLYHRFPELTVVAEGAALPSFVSNSVVSLTVRLGAPAAQATAAEG